MSAPTFTPGPWHLDRHDGFREPSTDDFAIVAPTVICPAIVWGGLRESEANANLIAAAPDLFAELRETLIALPDHSRDCKGWDVSGTGAACCFFAERHRNARAVLAKAEGRAP